MAWMMETERRARCGGTGMQAQGETAEEGRSQSGGEVRSGGTWSSEGRPVTPLYAGFRSRETSGRAVGETGDRPG